MRDLASPRSDRTALSALPLHRTFSCLPDVLQPTAAGLELDIQLAHGTGLIEPRVVEVGLVGIHSVGEQRTGRLAGAL